MNKEQINEYLEALNNMITDCKNAPQTDVIIGNEQALKSAKRLFLDIASPLLGCENHDDILNFPKELTAENGAKALLMGEFSEPEDIACPEGCDFDERCPACHGNGIVRVFIPIQWDTIKNIYRRIFESWDGEKFTSKTGGE